jgi:hypothetical protein
LLTVQQQGCLFILGHQLIRLRAHLGRVFSGQQYTECNRMLPLQVACSSTTCRTDMASYTQVTLPYKSRTMPRMMYWQLQCDQPSTAKDTQTLQAHLHLSGF